MSHVDLRRVVDAARDYHRELARHGEQYDYLDDDKVLSVVEVGLAAQRLYLALQGRDSIFDPPPEAPGNAGVRVTVGQDISATIQLGVIRTVLPRLLYCIGCRPPSEMGLPEDEDFRERMGIPSVAGVKMRPGQGQSELDALAQAADRLEEIVKATAPPLSQPDAPAPPASGNQDPPPTEDPADLPDLVTLDQAAAAIHRSKRTLERRKTKGTLPGPTVEGGGGTFALYDWKTLRPWLAKEFGVPLPKRFPGGWSANRH